MFVLSNLKALLHSILAMVTRQTWYYEPTFESNSQRRCVTFSNYKYLGLYTDRKKVWCSTSTSSVRLLLFDFIQRLIRGDSSYYNRERYHDVNVASKCGLIEARLDLFIYLLQKNLRFMATP